MDPTVAQSILLHIAAIIVLGIAAQWAAWRLGLPSILLLLLAGVAVGRPVAGWILPDELFGQKLLFPLVSISVALILYEGGLTLRMSELPKVGAVVRNLVTVGAAVTWAVGAVAGHYILGLDSRLAILLAAILVVTGPTVISPLLRHIRPSGSVGTILKWEGLVIDPIGATFAVLIFELTTGETGGAISHVAAGLLKTLVYGGGFGLAAAGILIVLLARYWVADHLQNAVSLMLVVAAFAGANLMQHESGLLAATVMGFALANQKWVDVKHIVEFKENLRVLILAGLFIVLGARLDPEHLTTRLPQSLLFVGVMILVARPLSVFASTWRSSLSRREKLFLAWMAPRGIVAAAVASVFSMRLVRLSGFPDAEVLESATFITIMMTVAVYGLTAPLLARRLGVAERDPQGILFVGAHPWAREIAAVVKEKGFRVTMVDSNRGHAHAARMAGLPTHVGSILGEQALDELDLGGIGRMLCFTRNDWVNVLAIQRFQHVLGKSACYQLAPPATGGRKSGHQYLYGRWLFDKDVSYDRLDALHARGFTIKATKLSEAFDFAAFRRKYGEGSLLLFIVSEKRQLTIVTSQTQAAPQPGDQVIAIVAPPGGNPPEGDSSESAGAA